MQLQMLPAHTSAKLWNVSSSMLDKGSTAHRAMTWPSESSSVGLLMLHILMPALL